MKIFHRESILIITLFYLLHFLELSLFSEKANQAMRDFVFITPALLLQYIRPVK